MRRSSRSARSSQRVRPAASRRGSLRGTRGGLAARVDTRRPAIVRGYVTANDPAAARAAIESVQRDLGHLQAFALRPIGELETRLVNEEDWAEAWKEHFPVMRVGHRIVIKPSWRDYEPRPDDVVIALDPGMAFGTGLHPDDCACAWTGIERWSDEDLMTDARVLDVGTGSGILASRGRSLGRLLRVGHRHGSAGGRHSGAQRDSERGKRL